MFKVGKSIGKSITQKIMSSKYPKTITAKKFLSELENLGFGFHKLRQLDKKKKVCVVNNNTNAMAKQNKKTFGKSESPTDFFLSGLYAGCLSLILDEECYFQEKKCIASNDKECVFHMTLVNPFRNELFSQESLDQVMKWENLHSRFESNPNPYIQKVVALNQIKIVKGELLFWNIYCAFFPIPIYLVLYKVCKQKGFDIANEICYLTIVQARTAVLFQKNKFGVKSGIDTFNSLLHQLETFGVGKGEVVFLDDRKLTVQFKKSYSLRHYQAMFQSNVLDLDIHLNGGSIIGMAQYGLGRNVIAISNKISKDGIYYEIIFGEGPSIVDSLKEKIADKRIMKTIEEKMNHKYYLN